ncbi:MAG: hypothetical protein OEY49_09855 [Candidatus Heimdallarchaeota archaeon]|nr:hypothetical protein [Candidatus Heimdallarchaeota archaeon]
MFQYICSSIEPQIFICKADMISYINTTTELIKTHAKKHNFTDFIAIEVNPIVLEDDIILFVFNSTYPIKRAKLEKFGVIIGFNIMKR